MSEVKQRAPTLEPCIRPGWDTAEARKILASVLGERFTVLMELIHENEDDNNLRVIRDGIVDIHMWFFSLANLFGIDRDELCARTEAERKNTMRRLGH